MITLGRTTIASLWRFLLCATLLFLTPNCYAAKFFTDNVELEEAVDVILSGNDTSQIIIATYGPMEEWDVSRITHFDNLFNARSRNPLAANVNFDLSKWDTSSAKYMHDMFLDAAKIDFDVGGWDTSKVLHFNGMWEGATSFQGRGLEKWNVHSGIKFMVMFAESRFELHIEHGNVVHRQINDHPNSNCAPTTCLHHN